MKKNDKFCLSAMLLLIAFLLIMNGTRRRDEALAARVAPEVLRFHVLANSDRTEDQALKLEVKDFLLGHLRQSAIGFREPEENADSDAFTGPQEDSFTSKHMLMQYILDNKTTLEAQTEAFIQSLGFDYPAQICLETCAFPEKTYGDMTFPAGTYDAVRVLIGDGAGENFWCVLYPSLCYLDSTYAVVPEESKDVLRAVLPEDDFEALLDARRLYRNSDSRNKSTAQSDQTRDITRSMLRYLSSLSDRKTEQDILLPRITFRFKFTSDW